MQTPTPPFQASRIHKSASRIAVEQLIQEHTKRGGISPARCAEILSLDVNTVRRSIAPLRDSGQIVNIGTTSKPIYVLAESININAKPLPTKHISQGQYTGFELRQFDGRPGAMDAYKLPSLRDGQLYPYNGIRPQLVGALKDTTNNAR